MDVAFYTYFYGSNRNIAYKIPNVPSIKYNCYYYTNNHSIVQQLHDTKWIAIYDNNPTHDDILESCMVGKYIKTCPHKYIELAKHKYLCFLDSKLENVNETFVENFIQTYFIQQNYALLVREHWGTFHENPIKNVWNEYHASMDQPRYIIESDLYIKYINTQIENGLSETSDHFCACGFFIRNMCHPKINEINETWHTHILDCGIQDQISFFFVNQLFREYIYPFTEIPFY